MTKNKYCTCEYPLIRTNIKGGEYCGICHKDIKPEMVEFWENEVKSIETAIKKLKSVL